MISLDYGVIYKKYSKKKLNIKSSTETEVVGASDYIGYTLYIQWFLKEHSYTLRRKTFYQDNMNAIKMKKNGSRSCE